jgi:hypothetical protein
MGLKTLQDNEKTAFQGAKILAEQRPNDHIHSMDMNTATNLMKRATNAPVEERSEGRWRVYPMEGALELHYVDQSGNPSRRWIIVRELKVGPGKTLLGGIDMADDGYRGFRGDRIERIIDAETGRVVDRNIVDWLIRRAESQAKERRKDLARAARESRRRDAA